MSHLTMGSVGITQYVNDEAGLVEYRIRWTAEIDALASRAAAPRRRHADLDRERHPGRDHGGDGRYH